MEFQRVHQQLLQSHHLFEPLSPVQLQELLASSDLVNLDKGAYVFRQGEPAHAFYYLISGCVKIYRLTPEGQEKILEVTNERNTFAEAMMFMDTPNYVATAQAVVPSQLFRFSNKAYLRQLQDNTPLALALLAKLSTRLHQRIDEIETLSLKNATHRVVRYLLTLAAHAPGENCRVEIPGGQATGGRAPVDPAGNLLADHAPPRRRGHHPPRRPRNQHPRPRTPGVLRVNSPAA
ncbi:transcriptional regulator Dnr [Pseudomonas aeruginosa]|nr:transcriptional regulator Dnr [Pseudomonas aeruginosa]